MTRELSVAELREDVACELACCAAADKPCDRCYALVDRLIAAVRAEEGADARRLDWLEEMHTLHQTVEFLYVVDGYEASILYDDNLIRGRYHGDTIRAAIDAAMGAK